MKHTKKLLTWILIVTLLICCGCLCCCTDKPVTQNKQLTLPELAENQMAIIVKVAQDDYVTYVAKLSPFLTTVADVLLDLSLDGTLPISYTDGPYGMQINSIDKLVPNTSNNEFVAFFTSVTDDQGSWAGVPSYLVCDVLLVSAGVGVSQAEAQSGAIVYFEMGSY